MPMSKKRKPRKVAQVRETPQPATGLVSRLVTPLTPETRRLRKERRPPPPLSFLLSRSERRDSRGDSATGRESSES